MLCVVTRGNLPVRWFGSHREMYHVLYPPPENAVYTENRLPFEQGFFKLRGKGSNLHYLIQSQASYH